MEHGLKQRIIGALVLVVAAVIFLPMLLSGQDETVEVQVDVPAAPVMDNREIVTAQPPTLPEPAPVPEIPQPSVEPLPAAPEPVPDVALIEPPTQVVTPTPAPTAEPAPTPAAAATGGWVVQQGSFSSQSNAESFRQTLAGQGYNAYVRAGQTDGKSIVRVYVGPLSTREAATRIRDELARRHKSKGLVVAHDDATRAR
ncbi:MAG: SPOR domain-containing protein [Pseudomonas sp.]